MSIFTDRQRVNFESHYTPEPNSGCYLWFGATNVDGYGRFNLNGKIENAHRAAFMQANGRIPAGMLVLHSCDNRACVNPEHLRLGSDADNAKDKIKRLRVPRKISDADVEEIRAASGRYRDIADAYGISASYVSLIKDGKVRNGMRA